MTTAVDHASNAYHDELGDRIRGKECRTCESQPRRAWDPAGKGKWYLRCNCYPQVPSLLRLHSAASQYRQGLPVPIHIANRLEDKLGRRTMGSKQLAVMSDTQIAETNKVLFGSMAKVPDKERGLALVRVGFDPRLHLEVYQGRPMVNIDGMFWWAGQRRNPTFSHIVSDPITEPTLKEAYGIGPEEIGVIAKLYVKGNQEPFCTGFGRASKDGQKPVQHGSAVEKLHPYRMAEKRAEAQAIRKFHPPAIEGFETADDEIPAGVDGATGEIIEGTFKDTTATTPELPVWCPKHETNWYKSGQMREHGHVVEGEKGPRGGKVWCNREAFLAGQAPPPAATSTPDPAPVDPETGDRWGTDPPQTGVKGWKDIYDLCVTQPGAAQSAVEWLKAEHNLEYSPKWFSGNQQQPAGFENEWVGPLLVHLTQGEETG